MHAATDARDAHDLADRVVRRLVALREYSAAGIWQTQGEHLVALAQSGFDQPPAPAQIHRVIETGAPVFFENTDASRRPLLFLPLPAPGRCEGALVVQLHDADPASGRPLLEAAAGYTALALANMRSRLARPSADQSSEREWDEFLAHAAHEIKNPLASVKGYADLLMRRATGEAAESYHKGLTIIAQQVGRTTSLLEQISDLSRIGMEHLRINRHPADLASIVRQAVEEQQARADRHQIQLVGADAPLPIRCDEIRVSQVISIMLSNAIGFSPQGGPIVVRLRRADAPPADGGHGEEAIVSVTDRGIGVPDGEQEHVFERFFRGSNVVGAYRGLGISLYIARAIVERHGGRIWITSVPGQETTCFVALPL